jgi:hypothetical protein
MPLLEPRRKNHLAELRGTAISIKTVWVPEGRAARPRFSVVFAARSDARNFPLGFSATQRDAQRVGVVYRQFAPSGWRGLARNSELDVSS